MDQQRHHLHSKPIQSNVRWSIPTENRNPKPKLKHFRTQNTKEHDELNLYPTGQHIWWPITTTNRTNKWEQKPNQEHGTRMHPKPTQLWSNRLW